MSKKKKTYLSSNREYYLKGVFHKVEFYAKKLVLFKISDVCIYKKIKSILKFTIETVIYFDYFLLTEVYFEFSLIMEHVFCLFNLN